MIIKEKIYDALTEVLDPELNISIVDLGLVYNVEVDEKEHVKVTMTLTTIGCPLFNIIEQEVKSKLQEIGIPEEHQTLELTFEPPWTMERLSENAKALLGI